MTTSSQSPRDSTNKQKTAHDTLCRFIQITIQKNNHNNLLRLIKELDCITSYKPESIRKWYLALADCIPFLQLDRHRNLWTVIFERFRWDFPKSTLEAYSKFCTLLISNHPIAIKPLLQSLCVNFIRTIQNEKCITNDTGMIHTLLQQIHSNRPMMSGLFINYLIDLFPNILIENDSNIIGVYVEQLLLIIQYIPELRPQIIQLIIEKMVLIDVEIEKRDKLNHEKKHNDSANDDDNDVLSDNLDDLMCLMFDYIKIISDDDEKLLNELYQTISRIFEGSVLSTHEITSVQFIMFYLCSFRTQFAEEFVSRLMRLCTDINRPTHERCFAAGYIGGYVSKAKYLRQISAFSTLQILIQWLMTYIQLYRNRYPFVCNIGQREAKNHALFYAVSQSVFRIYTHHQHTFDSMFQNNPKIPNCLYQLTQSCLQPFKYCHGLLVRSFVISIKMSVVMDISLFPAYGSSKNVYLASSTFTNWNLFPFDSYHLCNSSEYLNGLFMTPIGTNDDSDDDGDDWIVKTSDDMDVCDALTPSIGPTDHEKENVSNRDKEEFLI